MRNEISKKLSCKILKRREELSLSQKEIALRANISSPYYNNIEKGSREPSLFVVTKLAQALEMPLEHLVHDLNPTQQVQEKKTA